MMMLTQVLLRMFRRLSLKLPMRSVAATARQKEGGKGGSKMCGQC